MADRDSMAFDLGLTLDKMLADNNHIEIPIIQRDYAQGRASAKELIEDFLKDLFDHIESNERIKLSFVYGTVRDTPSRKIYIPYDGQQRITLVYLLTLYMAATCEDWDEIKRLSRFKYYTRDFATEFCDFLTGFDYIKRGSEYNNVFKRISMNEGKLVRQIKNDVEFFGAWEYDPTASSMMNVLEAIHANFLKRFGKDTEEARKSKAKKMLSALKGGCVFFDWCAINASDNIYIKMNGRGKPLSAFDNFKNTLYAELEKLREVDKNEGRFDRIDFLKDFEIKMDGVWTDMFWALREKLGGDESYNIAPFMMNFMFYVFELRYAEESTSFYFGQRMPFSWIDEKNAVSFLSTFKEKCRGEDKKARVTLDDYIWLSKLLDVLRYRTENGRIYNTTPEWGAIASEYDLLDSLSTSTKRKRTDTRYVLSSQDSIIAAIFYEYLVNASSFDLNGTLLACNDDARDLWIRFIGRIMKTAGHYKGRYDDLQRYRHVFQGINDYLIPTAFSASDSGDLIAAADSFDDTVLGELRGYFDASHAYSQLYEEVYKFKLVLHDKDTWEERIKAAEKSLPYFDNQIFFLFKLAEESDGNPNEKKFDQYLKLLQSIMCSEGIRKEYQNQFTALLLSFGDYRVTCSEGYGNAQGLCSNDSSESFKWRHFFDILDGEGKETRFDVMQKTFELMEKYGTITAAYDSVKEGNTGELWRDIIIKYPEILNHGSKHRIVYKSDDGSWYLIKSNGVSKQVHTTSLTDSLNIELYGIYRESGHPDKRDIIKYVHLTLENGASITREAKGQFVFSHDNHEEKTDYAGMIEYLKANKY